MRRLLLKVLLIAAFLNAAFGVPLHAGAHLAIPEPAHPISAPDDDDGDAHAHSACAWCLAHADASAAPPAAPDALSTGAEHLSGAHPAIAAAAGFSVGLWASSPRGPPADETD
jgi:hypothetical protein